MPRIKLADIPAYNRMRFDTPRAGICSERYAPNGIKEAAHDTAWIFGEFHGNYHGGTLYVNACMGDIVEWGQVDRHGQRGWRLYGAVQPDGTVQEIPADKLTAALTAAEEARKAGTTPPAEPVAEATVPNPDNLPGGVAFDGLVSTVKLKEPEPADTGSTDAEPRAPADEAQPEDVPPQEEVEAAPDDDEEPREE